MARPERREQRQILASLFYFPNKVPWRQVSGRTAARDRRLAASSAVLPAVSCPCPWPEGGDTLWDSEQEQIAAGTLPMHTNILRPGLTLPCMQTPRKALPPWTAPGHAQRKKAWTVSPCPAPHPPCQAIHGHQVWWAACKAPVKVNFR